MAGKGYGLLIEDIRILRDVIRWWRGRGGSRRPVPTRRRNRSGGSSGNVIYAQVNGAVGSGDPTGTFDNATGPFVGSIPAGGTDTFQNVNAEAFLDNQWVKFFQRKDNGQWLPERGGTAGSQVVYGEITEHKVYGDNAVLAKPVLADGTMDAGADAFYVVDEKNLFYGRAAESGEDGYRGFFLRFTDDYSEGVPGFRIMWMQGPAQLLIVTLAEAWSMGATACTVSGNQIWGRPTRGERLPPTGDIDVYDDESVATGGEVGDKWLAAWDEADEHYIFVLPLVGNTSLVKGMATTTIGAATMDGSAITCTPGITTSAVTKLKWSGAGLVADGSAIHGVNFSKTALRASTAEPLIVVGVINRDIPDIAEAFEVYSVYDLRMLPGFDATKKQISTQDNGPSEWNEIADVLDWLAGRNGSNDQSIGADAAGAPEWQDDSIACPE